MSHVLKGLTVVIVMGLGLYGLWQIYSKTLTNGLRPSGSTLTLDKMELEGVPSFTLADIHGQAVKLSQFSDKAVIINFWASWCDPCVEEFPSMLKLLAQFDGQVVMLAVSADSSLAEIKSFLKQSPEAKTSNLHVLWDKDQKLAKKFGTEVLPESYILAPGLKLVKKVSGSEDWSSTGAIALFKSILNLKSE